MLFLISCIIFSFQLYKMVEKSPPTLSTLPRIISRSSWSLSDFPNSVAAFDFIVQRIAFNVRTTIGGSCFWCKNGQHASQVVTLLVRTFFHTLLGGCRHVEVNHPIIFCSLPFQNLSTKHDNFFRVVLWNDSFLTLLIRVVIGCPSLGLHGLFSLVLLSFELF